MICSLFLINNIYVYKNTTMSYLSKSDIEYITKNITPEETQYVTDIASTLYDVKKNCNISDDKEDDIIYITKLLSFSAKLSTMYTISSTAVTSDEQQYRNLITDIKYQFEDYVHNIMENIQSIIGVIEQSSLNKLELPVSDNILEILNEIKQCVNNWALLHKDDIEYEGCKYWTQMILAYVHRAIYMFRLIKPVKHHYIDSEEPGNSVYSYTNDNMMPELMPAQPLVYGGVH